MTMHQPTCYDNWDQIVVIQTTLLLSLKMLKYTTLQNKH